MAIQLILAPAARGKTARAVDAIRALPPLSPVRVLVPDQIEAAAFRRRLAQVGGALGVEVQTFYGLYADVLALAACRAENHEQLLANLSPSVRRRLIQHIVGTLCDAGRLSYYAPLRHSSGFAHLLAELIGELKRARVFPEEFESALAEREPRLAELARIYAAYQAWLIEAGWMDADGQGWLAAIALEEHPALLSDLSLLVVDGFDELNPTQLRALGLLAGRAAQTLVTLTGDAERPHRLAHRRPARALAALRDMFDKTILSPAFPVTLSPSLALQARHLVTVACSASASPCPPLAHLEEHLFEPSAPQCKTDGAIEFIEAQNRAAETREALRWLKARIVRERVPLSEVAVIARDVTPYRPFLEEVAAEFGMPLRIVSGAELGANPAIAALLNLLALTLEPDSWSPRALLDALSSPYFDWSDYGLLPGDADRLGDVARDGQVISGLEQWREAFSRLAANTRRAETTPVALDEDLAPRRPPTGEEAARLQAAFENIAARIAPAPQAALRDRVAWIEDFIGPDPALAPRRGARSADDDVSLRVVARARQNPATAERDVAALRAFKEILAGLVLADSILKEAMALPVHEKEAPAISHSDFVAELLQALQSAAYTMPVEGEAILVASVLQARGLTFDSAALVGLAEGDFPRAEREDALLREADRAWLKARGFAIEPRLRGDEAALFYQAVTRARRRLLLCRPYLADDGQPWEPSPYWSAALRLFEGASVAHIRPTDPVPDAASEQERIGKQANAVTQASAAILRARSNHAPSVWKGDLSTPAVQAALEKRFGRDQLWSSSRLETYAKCPFYFWAAYAMDLEPREPPQAGYDVMILGSIYHLVLERLYGQVPDGDPERLRAELPRVARRVYDAAPNDYGFRPTPLWERQQEELTEVLRRTLDALIDIAGDYKPLVQEMPFGLKDQPPLTLSTTLQLRGYIDRIDRAPDGRLRIIDYKAGSTPISAGDLADGHRLQLPLYALAAQQALGAEVSSGFYWHIASAKPSSLRLEKYQGGVANAVETAVEHALAIAAAVRGGRFAPAPPEEGCPRFCPAATFCDQYRPKSW